MRVDRDSPPQSMQLQQLHLDESLMTFLAEN